MFRRVCPILPVRDLVAALRRYVQLGFQPGAYEETEGSGTFAYGFLKRDDIELHLAPVPQFDSTSNTTAVYLYVEDADALFGEWTAADVEGQLTAPEDKPWGMREMAYIDPDGNLLRIGHHL